MAHDCKFCKQPCFCDGNEDHNDTPQNCEGCLSEASEKFLVPRHLLIEIKHLAANLWFSDDPIAKRFLIADKKLKEVEKNLHDLLIL